MATWTRDETDWCASESHGDDRAPSSWRMEAGGVGAYYCDECRSKIIAATEPPKSPLQQAIDKARGGPAPTPKRGYA